MAHQNNCFTGKIIYPLICRIPPEESSSFLGDLLPSPCIREHHYVCTHRTIITKYSLKWSIQTNFQTTSVYCPNHGSVRGAQSDKTLPTPDPRLYRVSFRKAAGSEGCPVEGCRRWATNCTNLLIHYVQCHVWDKIVILEECNHPHPRFPACDIFLP